MNLDDLKGGIRLVGVAASGPVEVVAADRNDDVVTLVYRDVDGKLDQRLVTAGDAERFELASEQRWTFDADGNHFRLASEARRIQLAAMEDPRRVSLRSPASMPASTSIESERSASSRTSSPT